MKILWLCNIMLPRIAKSLSMPYSNSGGWLTGISDGLLKRADVELIVLFPVKNKISPMEGMADGTRYFAFEWNGMDFFCNKNTEQYFCDVLNRVEPDIVHIFGTEFPHTLEMVHACEITGYIDRTVINIQGLVSVLAEHYFAFLPRRVIYAYTLRDLLRRDNIRLARKKFQKRGKLEIEALQKTPHIIGRTDWDRACIERICAGGVNYYFCNETLRDIFYHNEWSLEKCERHSVFLSQWGYPIKGFHLFLEAIPDLIKKYPDMRIYITGDNPFAAKSVKETLKTSYYQIYIKNLIKKYRLEKHILFLGKNLNAQSMCKAYMRAHAFLLPSSIENSPNSLGEAMLLGVPCVASDVGGVRNMLKDKEEGFIYPADEYYMIAYYISLIFDNDDLARSLSAKARLHALQTHNREKNLQNLMCIYDNIIAQ